MLQIKPAAAIRKNYDAISALCKSTQEPVFLTKNGEGDLVVMDIGSFSRRESMLQLREQLVAVEEDRLAGKKSHTVPELDKMLKQAIQEVSGSQHESKV